MRIIARKRLTEWGIEYPDAANALVAWADRTEVAAWQTLMDVRRDFPTADGVVVRSGRIVTVFNIRGNKYRLITAIHYRGQRVYTLRFLTHPEYDDGKWKDDL
jgi:mRNA interferase HigB